MKNLWKRLLWVLPMLFFVACGGGNSGESNTKTSNLKEFKVKVNVPNSVQSKASFGIQKETDSTAITRVEVEIKTQEDNVTIETFNLLQFDNIWSGAFVLDATKAPFIFVVHAYDKTDVERYSGTTVVSSVQESVILSVSSVSGNGDTIKEPYLKGITSTLLADGKQQLNVTVVNETFEDMNYSVTAVPNECIKYFEPAFGTITFREGVLPAEQTFILVYDGDANESCLEANYFLEMQTISNQGFTVPLNLQNGLSGIVVNFPPKIDSFNFTQDGESIIFKVSASDAEEGEIFYKWEEVVEDGEDNKLDSQSPTNDSEWRVIKNSNYPQQETYKIKVTLSDYGNATRSYTLVIKNSSLSINTYKYPIKKTGQIEIYVMKDDGYYQKGVTPSYTRVVGKDIVIDNVEGYMWQDDSNVSTQTFSTVADAESYCQGLTLGGYTDWKLPPAHMLYNLIDFNQTNTPFLHEFIDTNGYFTSSSYTDINGVKQNYRVTANTLDTIPSTTLSVRCMRYHTPLIFLGSVTRSSQGIVTDSRYGLEWQDDYNGTLTPITSKNLSDDINYCETLTLGGKSDWRLPNIFELVTLGDYTAEGNITNTNPTLLNNEFKAISVNSATYMSSTTWSGYSGTEAYVFSEITGETTGSKSSSSNAVRCVRDK